MTKHHFSYLALGDSYTIGEAVPLYESFPYQVVQLLRKAGLHFYAPEIIAKTGWSSFELAEHILHTSLNEQYDFVTLLIGVNNQYRGLHLNDFETDFDFLLKKAIHLTGNNAAHVIVLSIPDWSVTPFGTSKNIHTISKEISAFNTIAQTLSAAHNITYIDITPDTRLVANNTGLLAPDKLHYSAQGYEKWAEKIVATISKNIS